MDLCSTVGDWERRLCGEHELNATHWCADSCELWKDFRKRSPVAAANDAMAAMSPHLTHLAQPVNSPGHIWRFHSTCKRSDGDGQVSRDDRGNRRLTDDCPASSGLWATRLQKLRRWWWLPGRHLLGFLCCPGKDSGDWQCPAGTGCAPCPRVCAGDHGDDRSACADQLC